MNTPQSITKPLASVLVALSVSWLLSGCSLGTTARSKSAESIAASHDSTIVRALRGESVPSVTVSGTNNSVRVGSFPLEQTVSITDAANTKGAATASANRTFSASVSFWVAIALALVALSLVLIVVLLLLKMTAAGKATDSALSAVIDSAHAGVKGAGLAAQLEKVRGKLRR